VPQTGDQQRDDEVAVSLQLSESTKLWLGSHLFSSWYNRGILVLQRIDWSTPAMILKRIIRYEALCRIVRPHAAEPASASGSEVVLMSGTK